MEIIDVASRQTVKTNIDGSLLNYVEHTDGNLALFRDVGGQGGGMASAETEVLLLSPDDGTLRSVEPLGDRAGATSSDAGLVGRCPLLGRRRWDRYVFAAR